MISENEYKMIKTFETKIINKGDLAKLETIYKRETGNSFTGCFCSSVQRRIFKKTFYEWYNATYPTPPEA
jgi:hypothetical protein